MKTQLIALVLACGFGSQPPVPPGIPPNQPAVPQVCIDACPGAVQIIVTAASSADRPGCQCQCWNGLAVATFSDRPLDLHLLNQTFLQICPALLSPGDNP